MTDPRRPYIASRQFWLGVACTLLVLTILISAVSTIAEWWG